MENTEKWIAPKPLRRARAELPAFPLNSLPLIPLSMAAGIAETTSTDTAMCATAILSALSYCFSGVYRMEGKPDHTEPLTLYSLILAEPAERKSPIMRFVKEPFVTFGAEYNKENEDKIRTSWERRDKLIAEYNEMKQGAAALPEDLAKKKTEAENCEVLNFRTVCVDDVTPEALAKLLEENRTLLMISDEAGVFKNFGGRYSGGIPNLDLLLKCWSGESYQRNRCNSPPLYLEKPYLSVCLCGQPYILDDLMENRAFLASGMVARFIYCFPKSFVGQRRYNTEALPNGVANLYKNLVYSALEYKFGFKGEEIRLKFSDEARNGFAEYYDSRIEPVLRTDFAECPDWGGKYHGLILRLCGLFHCIDCFTEKIPPESKEVCLHTFENAAAVAEYYKQQARYAYSLTDADEVTANAEYIIKKLKANRIASISGRDLMRLCRKFRNTNELAAPLELLIEKGYIRERQQEYSGSGRKPGALYEINPLPPQSAENVLNVTKR